VAGTGERVASMFLDELCAGYDVDTRKLVASAAIDIEAQPHTSTIVIVRDIHVVTMCPHHLLPSMGVATVAFKPTSRLVGLGTIAALVDAHARRLALQEHIGQAIADDLHAVLSPAWTGARLVLSHGCMIARGERAVGTKVETIALIAPAAHTEEAHRALGVGTDSAPANSNTVAGGA